MTASDFEDWLMAMGISAAKAALMLGVSANTVSTYRSDGTNRKTALACAALFHRLQPWGT